MRKFLLCFAFMVGSTTLAQPVDYDGVERVVGFVVCDGNFCSSSEAFATNVVRDPVLSQENPNDETTCVCMDEEGFAETVSGQSPIALQSMIHRTFSGGASMISGRLERTINCSNAADLNRPADYPSIIGRSISNGTGSFQSHPGSFIAPAFGQMAGASLGFSSGPILMHQSGTQYFLTRIINNAADPTFHNNSGFPAVVLPPAAGGTPAGYPFVNHHVGGKSHLLSHKNAANVVKHWVVSSKGTADTTDRIFITRLNDNGSFDTTFHNDGILEISAASLGLPAPSGGFGLVVSDIDADGRLTIAFNLNADNKTSGTLYSTTTESLIVIRTISTTSCTTFAGCLDTSFSGNGIATLGHDSDMRDGWRVASLDVANDGISSSSDPETAILLIEKITTNGSNTDVWVYNLNGAGDLDTTFNTAGRRRISTVFGNTNPAVVHPTQVPDIVITTVTAVPPNAGGDIFFSMAGPSGADLNFPDATGFVVKLTIDGQRDTGFGINGEELLEGIPFGMQNIRGDFSNISAAETVIAVETDGLYRGHCGNL